MSKTKKISLGSFGSENSYLIKKNKYIVAANLFENFFSGNISGEKIKTQVDPYNFYVSRHTLLSKKINKKTNKKINNFFFSFFLFFFKKITFKGKGFKLKKTTEKKFKFFFGHSHPVYFFNFNINGRRITKYKHVFFCSKYKKLKKILISWARIKPVSWYTKRGLKFSTQILQSREGKKAQQ